MPFIIDLVSSTTHEEIERTGWGNRVKINNQSVMNNSRGWNVAIFNENGSLRIQRVFDTWAQRHQWNGSPANMYSDFVNFLNSNVSHNDIVVIVVVDGAPYLNESQAAQKKFNQLGVSSSTMERLVDAKYSAGTRVEIPGWIPWIFASQNGRSLIDKLGVYGSSTSASVSIESPTERAAKERDLQIAERNRISQSAIAAAQAEALRQQEIARQAEIERLKALAAQKEAEKKAEENAKLAAEEAEKRKLAELAMEQDHLTKCEEVASSQEKVLSEVFPSLRDTVSFLRNMDKQKVIPEETLREMEQQLLTVENRLTLKK